MVAKGWVKGETRASGVGPEKGEKQISPGTLIEEGGQHRRPDTGGKREKSRFRECWRKRHQKVLEAPYGEARDGKKDSVRPNQSPAAEGGCPPTVGAREDGGGDLCKQRHQNQKEASTSQGGRIEKKKLLPSQQYSYAGISWVGGGERGSRWGKWEKPVLGDRGSGATKTGPGRGLKVVFELPPEGEGAGS